MSEEVTKIINALCEKLGVAANILIPEIAKYHISRISVEIIFDVIIFVAMIKLIVFIFKYKTNGDSFDDFDIEIAKIVCGIIPAIILVITVFCISSNFTDLAGWIASPTAAAIREITAMIK